MAPPVPRSKLSRLVIEQAREWKSIIDNELPLLEEYDTLEDLVKATKARNEGAEKTEVALKQRLADLHKQEEELSDRVSDLQKESKGIETLLKTTNADVEKKAKAILDLAQKKADDETDKLLAEARFTAEDIKGKAIVEAKETIVKGKAEVDAYKAKLKSDISELEARLDDLKSRETLMTESYAAAQTQLASLRKALGVH